MKIDRLIGIVTILHETGKRDIPTEVLIRLAELYHTSTDYLLSRTDDPRPYPPAAR